MVRYGENDTVEALAFVLQVLVLSRLLRLLLSMVFVMTGVALCALHKS